MKINFITEFDGNINSGISKKVLAQASNIRKAGAECDLYFITPKIEDLSKYDNVFQIEYPGPPYKSIRSKINSLTALKNILIKLLYSFDKSDSTLFRYIYPFPFFSELISDKNVFLEVVSNPIQEAKIRRSYLYLALFYLFRNQIGNSAKGIISVTRDLIDATFPNLPHSIPRLVVGNGIDVEAIELASNDTTQEKCIHFTCVANVSKWHGLDRFLLGLSEYKGHNEVYFHIVGEGRELSYLKELTTKLKLESTVTFYGEKNGDELNDIFNITHVGVGNLGTFRKNIRYTSPLKSREYCARGIPFIYTCRDEDFPEDFLFAKEIEASDNPVDIQEIIGFYQTVRKIKNFKQQMRTFAEENLSWSAKVIKINEFIAKNSNALN